MKTLKNNSNRFIALGTLGAMTLGSTAAMTTPAQAISAGTWKKIAIGAGVVTGYGLLKGNKKLAIIGGVATVGSYLKYRHDKKKQNQSRYYRYRSSSRRSR